MYAILIHLIGFALIDAAMPSWASEAGWLVLSSWYGAFVAIDMVAILFCRNYWLHVALAASCSWSACVMIDVSFGSDLFQARDYIAQFVIDAALIACASNIAVDHYRAYKLGMVDNDDYCL